MPFPDGLPTKLVKLTIINPTGGAAAKGTVRMSPNVPAIVIDGTPVQFTGSGTYEFDNQGRLVDSDGTTVGVRLLDNSAAGSNPVGWLWHAIITVDGQSPYPFYFTLAGTSSEVDLAELIQVNPSVPQYVAVPGPKGDPGQQGEPGVAGAPGEDGASAYQLAVASGFTGTESAWLASLVGPQGAPGPEGPQPPLGAAGAGDSTALRSTDPSTTNARTPTAHAASHGSSGNDPVTVAQSQVTGLTAALDARLPTSGGTVTGDLAVTGRVTASGFALPMFPAGPRPAYRPASWAQQFQSGHGWAASGSGVASSNANDTSVFCRGTQSFRVTTTGTGAVANVRRLGSALPDLTGKALRLIFRISDVTYLNQINVQVGTSSLANYFQWRLHTHASTAENQVLSGEWAVMTLSWADVRSAAGSYSISSTGVPSVTSGFTDLLVQFVDNNTGNPITINLQAIEIVPDTTETFPNGVVSITFDDSYVTQFTGARPKMDTLGFRGTLYTICDVIGTGGYLTVPQLQSVQANSGWEIAGHAYTVAAHNAKYNTLPAATVEDDVRKTRMWMVANGFTSDSFAYPGGWFSKSSDGQSIEALTCRYFSNGRGISSADNLESFPPPSPYRMRSITGIGSLAGASARGLPANLVGNGGALDRCQLNGDWTILTFHEIVVGTAATTNQCSQADFDLIMDGIAARGIPVLPVGDVLRLYS